MGDVSTRRTWARQDSIVSAVTRSLLSAVLLVAGAGAAFAVTPTPTAPPSDHGTVTGVVLDDVTGLPLAGASVVIGSAPPVLSDARGRYVLAASGSSPVLIVSKAGMTTVERSVAFAAGVNTVPVDARLKTLATSTPVTPSGATLQSGSISVVVPAGAVGASTPCQLTPLSAQGLPGLLPLGWSSLAAFDLRTPGVTTSLAATVGGLAANSPGLDLAVYDKTLHAWTLLAAALAADAGGTVTLSALPATGAYAIVVPDTPGLVPVLGQKLVATVWEGQLTAFPNLSGSVSVPSTATVTADVNPPSLPATGGTAQVTLHVQSSPDLPSGTVLAANATQSFTLATGAKGAEEQRLFDVLLYRNPPQAAGGLTGTIPVTPERTFLDAELASGDLALDILAGREVFRGEVSDGSSDEVDDEDTQLVIPAGALPSGTSVLLEQAATLSTFLPQSPDLTPLSELVVDFSGQTLTSAAQVSVLLGTLSPTDTFLIARVDRYDGIPYLAVVSRAQLSGNSVVSVPAAGLPGIVVGGRYVLYRSAMPVGFVAGTTTAAGAPIQSLVQSDSLPFVGLSSSNGSYILAASAGAAHVTARVGTPLAGDGAVTVIANQTVALDIALTGQGTVATVSPANGAILVPVSTQVTITVPVAFDPATVGTGNVQLLNAGTPVNAHLVLSGNKKSIALIPDVQLAFTTSYTLQTGALTPLKDVNGIAVVVPATTFTTGANTPPAMHPELLVFAMPDANGLVAMSAPTGSFPAGSSIFVVDSDNGGVLSTSVGNQGEVAPILMPASINDEMMVTITDPLHNTISFKRSQYEDVVGHRTAVGPGGGVVKGPEGLELRVPNGALNKGIVFTLEKYAPPNESKPTPFTSGLPAGATGYFGGGVKITVNEPVILNDEAKLAFVPPGLPTGAPVTATAKDAFYYVVERTTDDNGKIAYKLLDHAFVEGTGADARVVTASPPYPGITAFIDSQLFSLWATFNPDVPGLSLSKAIKGTVLRPVFLPGATTSTLRPVAGVPLSVVDGSGNDISGEGKLFAVSQPDGTFMVTDNVAVGGQYKIKAYPGGGQPPVTTSLYDSTPVDSRTPGLRFYSTILTANVTLPAQIPETPPGDVKIKVFPKTDITSNGTTIKARGTEIEGFVAVGTPLYIGLLQNRDADGQPIGQIESLTVTTGDNTVPLPLGLDYTRQPNAPDLMDRMAELQPFAVGTYRVTAKLDLPVGAPVTFSYNFNVIAQGGRNLVPLPNDPPAVIDRQTIPKKDASGVPTDVLIQLSFTEPVKGVLKGTTVKLLKVEGTQSTPVDFKLSGAGVSGGQPTVITDVTAADFVTGLTLKATGAGLEYNKTYRLQVTTGIVDGDNPPKHLAATYDIAFTTFVPAPIPGDGTLTASAGIAILDGRAYQTKGALSGLESVDTYDISRPVEAPSLVPFDPRPDLLRSSPDKPLNAFEGQPRDIAADFDTTTATNVGKVLGHTGGRYVVVATGPWTKSAPANLNVFDMSVEDFTGDGPGPSGIQTTWRGGVSLARNVVDGWISRIALKDGIAYSATNRKGVQRVDLGDVVRRWPAAAGTGDNFNAVWTKAWTDLNFDGQGYALDLVLTVPPPAPLVPETYTYGDIKVGDYIPGRLAITVGGDPVQGSAPFIITDTDAHTARAFAVTSPANATYPNGLSLRMGTALALGDLAGADGQVQKIAVVVGDGVNNATGAAMRMLAVVDLSALTASSAPVTRGAMALDPDFGLDVALWNDQALVSGRTDTAIISLSDLDHPQKVGMVAGVGGDLAVGTGDVDGMLYGSVRARFSEPDPQGGIKTGSLSGDPACPLADLTTDPVMLVDIVDPVAGTSKAGSVRAEFNLCRDARVTIQLADKAGNPKPILGARLDASTTDTDFTQPILLGSGKHTIALPAGVLGPNRRLHHLRVLATDETSGAHGGPGKKMAKAIPDLLNRAVLPAGRTFVKGVDLYDGHLALHAVDIKIAGRHLSLESTRSYSSAGHVVDSPFGASWSWNYASAVTKEGLKQEADGTAYEGYSVTTPDGSSIEFKKNASGKFVPQPGYHSSLESLTSLGAGFVFTDKAYIKYSYEPVGAAALADRWRLFRIEEPHHDHVDLTYDDKGLLVQISEVLAEKSTPEHTLDVTYWKNGKGQVDRIKNSYRVVAIEEKRLHYRVEYTQEQTHANLTDVTVYGDTTRGDAVLRKYSYHYYADADEEDFYQLHTAEGPNPGNKTEYTYYPRTDTAALGVKTALGAQESVHEVIESDGSSTPPKTTFTYTHPNTIQAFADVQDAMGNTPTHYTLDRNGSPWVIEQPGSVTTQLHWVTEDVDKDSEIDPLNRKTLFAHEDSWHNLTSETIQTGAAPDGYGDVTTGYQYNQQFGKLSSTMDANSHPMSYGIGAAGDLTSTSDAAGNQTLYAYDSGGHGLITKTTDPRGNETNYDGWDPSFGYPTSIHPPIGAPMSVSYNARGLKTLEDDGRGHVVEYAYDAHDQVTETRRRANPLTQSDNDVITRTAYYPSGQVYEVTQVVSPTKVITTRYTIDGLNRVTGTTTNSGPGTQTLVTTSASYDGNGNKIKDTDARGVVRSYAYDALNRLNLVSIDSAPVGMPGPTGAITRYEYDAVGNKTADVDVLTGARTEYHYDKLYRVDVKTLPEVAGVFPRSTETFQYDLVGNRTHSFDANGHETKIDYDPINRVTKVTDAENNVVRTEYDDSLSRPAHINKTAEIDDTHKKRVDYTYDALNREISRTVSGTDAIAGLQAYLTETDYSVPLQVKVTDKAMGGQAPVTMGVNRSDYDGAGRVLKTVVGVGTTELATQTSYDGLGNKALVIDPRGHQTVFGYDGLGRLNLVVDPLFQNTQYAYDPGGLKTKETDRRGVVKNLSYDRLGRLLLTKIDPKPEMSNLAWQQKTDYLYSPHKQVVTTNNEPPVTSFFDGLGRVFQIDDSDGVTSYSRFLGYDKVGNKTSETDRRGNATTFAYDKINRLTDVHDAPPFQTQSVHTEYVDALNLKRVTNRRSKVTETQMDALGRVLTVKHDGTLIETNVYDVRGRKVTTLDGESHPTAFTYDAADRVVQRADGAGGQNGAPGATQAITTTQYLLNGRQVKEQDRRALAGSYFSSIKDYDELDRLHLETNGEGEVTTYNYDPEGNRTYVKENTGPETTYSYDELGKLLQVKQPANGTTGNVTSTYAYDVNRNRIQQTDPNGHVVQMTYDGFDRLKELHQDPAGLNYVTTHTYDGNGNETHLLDPKGQTIDTSYDALNRPLVKTYGLGSGDHASQPQYLAKVTYDQYDANGNLLGMTEYQASGNNPVSVGSGTSRIYDSSDRLHSETVQQPSGSQIVQYTYYKNGARETVVDPFNAETTYTYDDQSRLASVTTGDGKQTQYTYHLDGLPKTVEYPNGIVATSGYDKADRLTSLTNENVTTSALVSSYAYTYGDGRGNRTQQTETNAGVVETTSYSYDNLNRLASITYPADTPYPHGRVVTYGYDDAGNRTLESTKDALTQAVLNTKVGVFDNVNRLQSLSDIVPAKAAAFAYDADGNTLTKTVGVAPTTTTTWYGYDVRDRQVEVKQGATLATASLLASYSYDADGRLKSSSDDQGSKFFVYDQTSRFLEMDALGNGTAKYDYGSKLIRLSDYEGPGNTAAQRYYSFDGLGSATALTDESGFPKVNLHLDAWGIFRKPSELDNTQNRVGFTGYFWSKSTNLYFAKARWYDPETARFTTQDDFKFAKIDNPPTLDLYLYVNDNPTRYTDPDGHCADPITGAICLGALSGAVTGAALDSWHQVFAIIDGAQPEFDPDQLRASGAWGAAAGGSIVASGPFAPEVAGAWMAYGTKSGLELAHDEWKAGYKWTAGYDAATTLFTLGLGAKALVRGASTVGEGRSAPVLKPVVPETTLPVVEPSTVGFAGNVMPDQVLPKSKSVIPALGLDSPSRFVMRPESPAQTSLEPAGQHGINLLSPRAGGEPFQRRLTWGGSEDLVNKLTDFESQVSLVRGKEVPHGTLGSSRPDGISRFYSLSIDVKNYDLETRGGRARVTSNIIKQATARQPNLPEGMRQGVILDARGQVTQQKLIDALVARIARKSDGLIQKDDIHVQY